MNYHRIYIALRTRWENDPTDRRVLDVARKAKRLWKKSLKVDRPKVVDRRSLQARCKPLQAVIEQGGRVLALDAEWTRDRPLTEVGLAIYQAGDFQYRNLRVLPNFTRGDHFAYGTTEFLEPDAFREEIARVFAETDFFVGHAIDNDHKQFSRFGGLPEIPKGVFDTLRFALSAYPSKLNALEHLVARAGLDISKAHNGGNDAAMTLHLALALVGCGQHGEAEADFYQHLEIA